MSTHSKRALVTGASSGIGLEFARQLATKGYALTVVARREDKLRALCDELPGEGHQALTADLSTEAGLDSLCAYINSTRIQLLINNAGYSVLEPFYRSDLALQQNILDLNCRAVVTLAHTFLQQAEQGDALINVASIVSYLPTPAQPMYSASKAFLAAFSECLWAEQQERGVYVMGLCPGVTRTDFIRTATGGESDGDTLPAAFIQTTTEVVQEALDALNRRRKAIVVTGRINRLLMRMPRFLSRHRLIKVLAVMGDPEKAL